MSFTRLGVVLLGLALGPAAFAKPVVTVTVGFPQVVIAPPPPVVVVAPAPVVVMSHPVCAGQNWVWVDGSWRRDAYGRPIWVGGHCAARPVVVRHVVAPPQRTVIVHRY